MSTRRKNMTIPVIVKWVIIIATVLIVGIEVKEVVYPKAIDVTNMVDMEKRELERNLGIIMNVNPNKVSQIYEWTDREITVDTADGIGVVYIDGIQKGLHIDHRKYSMFGLHIGLPVVDVKDTITYLYDGSFNVVNDEGVGNSTAIHYYNEENNDCLVVVYNDISSRVVALTYYNDYRVAMEELTDF